MPATSYCDKCLKNIDFVVREIEETFPVRGVDVNITSTVATCNICGNTVFNEELDSQNLERAYDKYRKEKSVLSPLEIKDIRTMYGLSQKAFSRLLGFGEITIHRYESGGIPDEAHNLALSMVKDVKNIENLLEKHPERITEADYKKVRESILDRKKEMQRNVYEDFEQIIFIKPSSIMNGFRQYAHERFANVVQYFAIKGPDYLWKTKLIKLLWYSDFYHFKKFSLSISGLQYARLPYGPCPDDYEILFGILARSKVFDLELHSVGDYEGEAVVCHPDLDQFNSLQKAELETLEEVWNTFKNYSAIEITKKSHLEKAWQNVSNGQLIPYSYAEHLSLPV